MNNLKKQLPSTKFESGIYTADKIKESMKHSFHHGKVRGLTTHMKEIDPHFSWKKGEVTGITGWPQHGKTEWSLFMMLVKSYFAAWKWAIYSPENMGVDHNDQLSAGEIFDTLIHMYIGKTPDPYWKNSQMSESEYEIGIEFVSKHFFVVYPEDCEHTLQNINDYLLYLKASQKVDGWLKDPWNSITHNFNEREDLYLSKMLSLENKYAKTKKIANLITVHPSGKPKVNNENDKIIINPTQFELSGGTMWNNKMDNWLCINRPNYLNDMADTAVNFHSLKIKKQKLVGIPGTISMVYDRRVNQYYINGRSPLYREEDEKLPF